MSELTPTNTQEVMLNNIAKALRGEEITDDVPVSWEHPEAFLKAILDAAKGMNPSFEDGGFKPVEDVYGTFVLGEYTEFQTKMGSKPLAEHGYEVIGCPSDFVPYTYDGVAVCIEDEESSDVRLLLVRSNYGEEDGKLFLRSDSDVGAEGNHLKIYKASYVCSANLIDLYDESDPHEDGSYLPACVDEDDDWGYLIDDDVDMSPVYKRLLSGQSVWIRCFNGDELYLSIVQWYIQSSGDDHYLVMYPNAAYDHLISTKNFGYESEEEE